MQMLHLVTSTLDAAPCTPPLADTGKKRKTKMVKKEENESPALSAHTDTFTTSLSSTLISSWRDFQSSLWWRQVYLGRQIYLGR